MNKITLNDKNLIELLLELYNGNEYDLLIKISKNNKTIILSNNQNICQLDNSYTYDIVLNTINDLKFAIEMDYFQFNFSNDEKNILTNELKFKEIKYNNIFQIYDDNDFDEFLILEKFYNESFKKNLFKLSIKIKYPIRSTKLPFVNSKYIKLYFKSFERFYDYMVFQHLKD